MNNIVILLTYQKLFRISLRISRILHQKCVIFRRYPIRNPRYNFGVDVALECILRKPSLLQWPTYLWLRPYWPALGQGISDSWAVEIECCPLPPRLKHNGCQPAHERI